MGSAPTYRVFHRTWWKHTPDPRWPNGREPYAGPRTVIATGLTEAQAQELCATWSAENDPGPLSRKAEYERED